MDGRVLQGAKHILLVIIGYTLTFIVPATAVLANTAANRPDIYLSANAGYGATQLNEYNKTLDNSNTSAQHTAFGLAIGYQFNNNLGLEASWQSSNNQSHKVGTKSISHPSIPWYVYAALRLSEPFFKIPNISINAAIGYAYHQIPYDFTDSSNPSLNWNGTWNAWAPVYGTGVNYAITNNITLGLQYWHLAGSNTPSTATDNSGKGGVFELSSSNIGTLAIRYNF